MDKKIIIIASIIFAIAFIGIMSVVLTQVTNYSRNTATSIANNNDRAVLSELSPYNEKIVSGDTIISFINTSNTLSDGRLLLIGVGKTGSISSGSTINWYGKGVSTSTGVTAPTGTSTKYTLGGSPGKATGAPLYYDVNLESTNTKYIAPLKEYKGHLVYDTNGNVCVGVIFTPM